MRRTPPAVAVCFLFLTAVTPLTAATHCVRADAAGAGTGADWDNAYVRLPAVLVRGDIYYIAKGTYPAYVFDDPDAGVTPIEVRAATSTDHGSGTGWIAGCAGQAVFQAATAPANGAVLNFITDYYVLNGQVRSADWKSGYNIKVDNTNRLACTADILMGNNNPKAVHDILVEYVEISGSHPSGDGCNEEGVESPAGSYNLVFRGLYNHHPGNCNFLMRGGGGSGGKGNYITVEYCYISDNYSSPAVHGEGFSCSEGMKYFTVRFNVIADMIGTAYIATPSGGGWQTTNVNNGPWYVYGNVFLGSNPAHCGTGDGALFFFDANFTDDVFIYNNTFCSIGPKNCGSYAGGIQIQAVQGSQKADMKGVYVSNNLWVNSSSVDMGCTTCGAYAWDYNGYFQMADNSAGRDADPSKQVGTQNPLKNWQAGDFRLVAATNPGKALSTPFNLDMLGTVRGADGAWDRGAMEYDSKIAGGTAAPGPAAGDNGGLTVFPNPFNPSTTVSYVLPVSSNVDLRVFDSAGKCVAGIVNGRQSAGQYSYPFAGKALQSGLYFCRWAAGDRVFTKRMALLK